MLFPPGRRPVLLSDDFIDGIVNFKVLVPIRYHQAPGS